MSNTRGGKDGRGKGGQEKKEGRIEHTIKMVEYIVYIINRQAAVSSSLPGHASSGVFAGSVRLISSLARQKRR